LKESTVNAIRKIAELTGPKCASCPGGDQYRCCDKMFCSTVKIPSGIHFDKPNVNGIPYMGEKGCVLPPEYRPMCSTFVCGGHLDDRKFRREYDRLMDKVRKEFPEYPDSAHLRKTCQGAFAPDWWGHNRKLLIPASRE